MGTWTGFIILQGLNIKSASDYYIFFQKWYLNEYLFFCCAVKCMYKNEEDSCHVKSSKFLTKAIFSFTLLILTLSQ
jgi:hypothetical protein